MLHLAVRKVTTGLSSKRAGMDLVTHLSIWKSTNVAVLTKR